jgi:hypothetical protein
MCIEAITAFLSKSFYTFNASTRFEADGKITMLYGDNRRARVFVSCGQRDDEEKKIASTIEQKLLDLGFDPYVAIHIQSTKSLMGNILEALRDCEYYLFIDFRREKIIADNTKNKPKLTEYRGSLFSNQELAIAAYLEKPIIAFQESGITKRDGLLSAIQANIIPFNNRKTVVGQVIKKVKKWPSNWRNEISFYDKRHEKISPEYVQEYGLSKLPVRFFHVTIKNSNKNMSTHNCVAYLESYSTFNKNRKLETILIPEPVELKWNGVTTQSVLIPPQMSRKFDAVFFYENNPHVVHIGLNPFLIDSSRLFKRLEGTKMVHLNFVVYSTDFSTIRATYILKIGNTLSQTEFRRK